MNEERKPWFREYGQTILWFVTLIGIIGMMQIYKNTSTPETDMKLIEMYNLFCQPRIPNINTTFTIEHIPKNNTNELYLCKDVEMHLERIGYKRVKLNDTN